METAPAQPTQQEQLINVQDPDTLEYGSIPASQLQAAISQGFKQASPEEINQYQKEQKFGTGLEQAKTAAESAASAATFGLSTGLETALGVNPEDIRARQEVNPGAQMAGQVAGLVGSSLVAPGGGAAGLMEAAGAKGVQLAGLQGGTVLSKIGSAGIKSAIENALFQSGDEVSKMFAKDPSQSAETALTDIGLSGLLGAGGGAGFGVTSAAWDAFSKSQTGRVLGAIVNKSNGVEGVIPTAIGDLEKRVGIDIPPEVRATFANEPWFGEQAKTLEQAATTGSALKYQEALTGFKNQLSTKIAESVGKTPDEIKNFSQATHGREAMDTFKKEFQSIYEPISKEYDDITKNFKTIDIPKTEDLQGDILNPLSGKTKAIGPLDSMADNISKMAEETGYNSANAPQAKIVNDVLERLPKQQTVEDLSKLNTVINNLTKGDSNLWDVGGRLKEIVLDAQQQIIGNAIKENAPNLFNRYEGAREAYKNFARMTGEASQTLSLGRTKGASDFLSKLAEKRSPEEFLKKLSPKGNAEILPFLAKNFPETLEKVRQNELFQSLKPAFESAPEGQIINTGRLSSTLEKMSPEMRDFVLPVGPRERVEAASSLLDKYNSLPHNFSGTARAIDKLSEFIPSSAAAIGTLLLGGGAPAALLIGAATKALAKDVPDAARLALLKFMGSSQQVEAGAFKTMVDFIQHTIKGENLTSKAVKGVLQGGKAALPQLQIKELDRNRLDKKLKELQTDPSALLNVGGKTAHYLPDQGTALAQTASTAVNYLNGLRPNTDKMRPLDGDFKASKAQNATFNRALDIAEQPLIVMKDVKEGTISPQDITTLQTIYPALYQRLSQKLTNELTDHLADGGSVPYKTRLGMSLFLGQPLDTTMTPSSIIAAQPKPSQLPQNAQDMPKQGTKHSIAQLGKTNKDYLLPIDARQMSKTKNA